MQQAGTTCCTRIPFDKPQRRPPAGSAHLQKEIDQMRIKSAFIIAPVLLTPCIGSAATLDFLTTNFGECVSGSYISACDWTVGDSSDPLLDLSKIDVNVELRNSVFGVVPTVSYVFREQVLNGADNVSIVGIPLPDQVVDLTFGYRLYSAKGIYAQTLELTGVEAFGAGGIIEVTETKTLEDGQIVTLETSSTNLLDSVLLPRPSYELAVTKTISITANSGGFITLGDMHEGYAPAPGPLALIAGGLFGVAALRRWRSRKVT